MRRLRVRSAVAVAAVAVVSLLLGGPAAAVMTENQIGCEGSADITDPDGKTYHADSDDTSVKVPREGTAEWQGSISTTTHNHFGEVKLAVGPFRVVLGEWGPNENAGDDNAASGTKEIPSELKYVVPGKYVVTGFHQGDEGRCAGRVAVSVDAAPLSTPTGILLLLLTVLSGAGVVFAARPKVSAARPKGA